MPPKNNTLPSWGNEFSMNLNPMILTNIQSSPYFKNELFKLKTYHEVIDEIYYKVAHLEPWERGSRQTSGQIGMCGGVRGVGAGGIVSSAYCLLYKLYTLKLTRKQVMGLLTHTDSPFIRGLGFMYIRYTQPPQDLWDWYEEYLEDEEHADNYCITDIDVKAGGGATMSIGEMLRSLLTKLEWYSTLFPRIPVPIMKDIERKMQAWRAQHLKAALEVKAAEEAAAAAAASAEAEEKQASRERPAPRRTPSPHRNHRSVSRDRGEKRRHRSRSRERGGSRNNERDRKRSRSRDRVRKRSRSRDRERRRSRSGDRRRRSRSRGKSHKEKRRSKSRERKRSRSKERKRSRSRERRPSRSRDRWDHSRHRGGERDRDGGNSANGEDDFARALQRERDRQQREKDRRSKRSSSKEHKNKSRSRSREASSSHRNSRDR